MGSKLRGACLVLSLCFVLLTTAFADTWLVASEQNYPPYNFNRKGTRVGIDVEIVNAVLEELHVAPQHRAMNWPQVVEAVEGNRVDVAIQFISTDARAKSCILIGPHRVGETVLMMRADEVLDYKSVESLNDKRVGVVTGFTYFPEFDDAKRIVKIPCSNNLLAMRRMINHRVDFVVGDRESLEYLAATDGLTSKVKILATPLASVPRFIAMPKARAEKAAAFKAAFERVKATGAFEAIAKKYVKR